MSTPAFSSAAANRSDVAKARSRGRSATRLVLSDQMRADMVDGLRTWAKAPGGRGSVVETVSHDGWRVDQVRDGLGVVGFVFDDCEAVEVDVVELADEAGQVEVAGADDDVFPHTVTTEDKVFVVDAVETVREAFGPLDGLA